MRGARAWLLALLVVFVAAYAIAQIPHTTWLRGSVVAVEEDLLSAVWPLAQSFDSPHGYGYTGDSPYPHLIQGDYGGTAFYPPGYPLLLWAVARVVGDPHRAGQIINGIAGVAFILATYWLALGWTRRKTIGLLAAALVATGSIFMTLVYVTSTDLLAAAGGTAALACAVWSLRQPERRRWILLAAAVLGLAFLIRRQTAVMLLPLLIIAAVGARDRPREAAIRVGGALAVFGAAVLPDLLVQYSLHGSAFHSAHGKNVWNAVVNRYDWPAWHEVSNSVSALSVISGAPLDFLRNWLGNLLYYSELLWLGPATYLVLPGIAFSWRRPVVRRLTVAALAAAGFVVVVAAISERGDRHALILLPTLAVLGSAAIVYGVRPRWRLRVALLAVSVSLAVGVAHTSVTVGDELQVPYLGRVAEALEEDGAQTDAVLTSYGSAHYAFYAGIGFEPLPGSVDSWAELQEFMLERDIGYFMARWPGLHDGRLDEAFEPDAAPPWLVPLWAAPEQESERPVVVYRLQIPVPIADGAAREPSRVLAPPAAP